jgi:hypothetical protein
MNTIGGVAAQKEAVSAPLARPCGISKHARRHNNRYFGVMGALGTLNRVSGAFDIGQMAMKLIK